MGMNPVPWTIHFPDSDLEDLRMRLERTRWPGDYGNDDWRYGVPESYLREFVDYWLTRYDWRVHETEMNSFSNFRVEIDEVSIHFIHERGVGPKPMPIVISHGFVPNHWDYRDVIRPLADPASYGGDPADAFDVVVPSIPGVGFSSPLRKVGVGNRCAPTSRCCACRPAWASIPRSVSTSRASLPRARRTSCTGACFRPAVISRRLKSRRYSSRTSAIAFGSCVEKGLGEP